VICGKAKGAELRREGFGLLWAEESNTRNEALDQAFDSKSFCVVITLKERLEFLFWAGIFWIEYVFI
jgi:hypothetical protein